MSPYRILLENDLVTAGAILREHLLPAGITKSFAQDLIREELGLPNDYDFGSDWQRIVSRARVRALSGIAPNSEEKIYYPRGITLPESPSSDVLKTFAQLDKLSRVASSSLPIQDRDLSKENKRKKKKKLKKEKKEKKNGKKTKKKNKN